MYVRWAMFHGLLLADGLWLISITMLTTYIVSYIIDNWNKPFVRRHTRYKKKTSCSRFYIRGSTKFNQQSTRHDSVIGVKRFKNIINLPFMKTSIFLHKKVKLPLCFAATERKPQSIRYDSDSFQIAIDNCATASFTNNKEDFIGEIIPISTKVQGIGTATATYKGTVKWAILDDQGASHQFILPGTRFQKDLPFRLLCPQHVAQVYNDKSMTCLTLIDRIIFSWGSRNYTKTVPLHKDSNVGLMWSAPSNKKFYAFAAQLNEPHLIPDDEEPQQPLSQDETVDSDIITIHEDNNLLEQQQYDNPTSTSEESLFQREHPVQIEFYDELQDQQINPTFQEPQDLTSKQEALRKCHVRLNHMPFARLQAMAKHGLLPAYFHQVEPPMCASCAYGKATRRPWRNKGDTRHTDKLKPIHRCGDCVSVDQLESPTPGFVGQIKGWLTTKRYRVTTVFVDHYSRLTFVYMQFSTGAEETLNAKRAFEAYASMHGVIIKHYHADNGRFAENLWLNAIETHRPQQTISFCGVGAHHQNGVAEKKIRDLQENARTMMLHAALRWTNAHSTSLWPYAIRVAADVMNSTPREDKKSISPIEVFASTNVRPQLKHFHSFGCPVYVLNAPLQTGQAQSKWLSRARLGIYLGMSPKHSRSVALVLNPRTGLVSPQWHIKFDDNFATVINLSDDTHGQWKKLSGFTTVRPDPTTQQQSRVYNTTTNSTMATQQQDIDENIMLYGEPPEPTTLPQGDTSSEGDSLQSGSDLDEDLPSNQIVETYENINFGSQIDETTITSTTPTLRRSNRDRKPSLIAREAAGQLDIALPAAFEVLSTYFEKDIADEMMDPVAFLAKTDQDTLYYHQAMKADDAKEFRIAMQGEIDDHENNKHWQVIPRDKVPEGTKVLDSVWAMKRKRRIKTKEVYRWKARLNVHGGQQEHGVNFWETFAPVVTWVSIRLVLILSIILNWHTRQIDFVLAYPQAPIETPLFMELPKGASMKGVTKGSKDFVLELKQNLYGAKQASLVWVKFLTAGLLKLGFIGSQIDACVFYREGTIFLFYVDDGIIAGPSKEAIDQVIIDLKTLFKVSDEGDITDYLGVNIEKRDDGTIKLSQPHLIDQIIADVNFQEDTKFKASPALTTKILNKDVGGEQHHASWHYRSIIGKLNFLEKSTRGELGYAVHQCARFCENPTVLHTEAVHRIVRFLTGTRNEGIILSPQEVSFECYADADFCGLWNKDTAEEDSNTARSQMGYLLTYAKCPIVWASKLAGPYCLSTTEAEYVALSSALRQVIPIMDLLEEMKTLGIVTDKHVPQIFCKAFEDNSGALEMARMPRMRPRTKHINCAYHHFRSHVAEGKITVHAISTDDQIGDLWTKPLSVELFVKFTKLAFGWDIIHANDLARESLKRIKKVKRGPL